MRERSFLLVALNERGLFLFQGKRRLGRRRRRRRALELGGQGKGSLVGGRKEGHIASTAVLMQQRWRRRDVDAEMIGRKGLTMMMMMMMSGRDGIEGAGAVHSDLDEFRFSRTHESRNQNLEGKSSLLDGFW